MNANLRVSSAHRTSWWSTKRTSSAEGRLRSIVLGFFLILAMGIPSPVGAANPTPDLAPTLDVTSPAAWDTLVGSRGGAYNYYRVAYQGGSAPVLFSLTYQPYWGSGNNIFGFNLYGPSGLNFAGRVTGTTGNSATAQFTLVNGAAMSVLVQVFKYSDGGSVSYTMTVSGLSGGSASTIVGQSNTSPDQAIAVIEPTQGTFTFLINQHEASSLYFSKTGAFIVERTSSNWCGISPFAFGTDSRS